MVEFDMSARPKQSGWTIFRRIMDEMQGFRGRLTMIALLGIVMAPLAMLQPLAIYVALSCYLDEAPLNVPLTETHPVESHAQ